MRQVEAELDRYLVLLGNKIRTRGFTQLEVQQELGWGRSYISQLVTKQKSLRVEQVLLILNVIGIEPAEYFAELYGLRGSPYGAPRAAPPPIPRPATDEDREQLEKVRSLLQGLVRLLLDKKVMSAEELKAAAEAAEQESY